MLMMSIEKRINEDHVKFVIIVEKAVKLKGDCAVSVCCTYNVLLDKKTLLGS